MTALPSTDTDTPLARALLNLAQWYEQTADEIDPEMSLMPDPPTEYQFKVGDQVLFHGDYRSYEAKVMHVHPAGRYVPERYHLYVTVGSDVLTWVHCFAERMSILLTAEAASVGRPALSTEVKSAS